MDPALAEWLTETVSHAAYLSQDVYGATTFAAAVTHPARVEFKVRRVVDHAGTERVSRAKVFFNGDVVMDLRDKLTLEDGTSPPILSLYKVRDETGAIDHLEVSL